MPSLHQTDYQFYAEDVNGLDIYYWSHTWYHADTFVNPTSGPTFAALAAFYGTLQPVGVTRNAIRSRRLSPTFQDYGTFTIPYSGVRSVSGPFTLTNVPRIAFYAGGKYAGYKRLRLPMTLDELDGQMIDSTYIATLASALTTLLSSANLCNWLGVVFDEFRIEPEAHMWQLRRGTNRRVAPVL